MDGWFKVHRQILDSRVFANENLLKLWIWCLCRANHKKRWLKVKTGRGYTDVQLQPGQFLFGRKSAAKILDMKPTTVYARMLKLEEWENIKIENDTHYSIVSIVNWVDYQTEKENTDTQLTPNRHPTDTQLTTNRQPNDTDKKDNNLNNAEKEKTHTTDPVPGSGANEFYQGPEEQKAKVKAGGSFSMPEPETVKFVRFFEKFERQTGKQECRFKFHSVMEKNNWSEEFYQKLLLAVEHFNEFNKTAFSEKVTYNPIQFFKKTWWAEEMPEGYKPKKPEEPQEIKKIPMRPEEQKKHQDKARECYSGRRSCTGFDGDDLLCKNEKIPCGHCEVIEIFDYNVGFVIDIIPF